MLQYTKQSVAVL